MDDSSSDLTRINQEIYKKSADLLERNKVLSLLHTIDEITLGSLTDLRDIARKVTDVTTAQVELKGMAIMLVNKEKNLLETLVTSQSEDTKVSGIDIYEHFKTLRVSLDNAQHILTQTILQKKRFDTDSFANIVGVVSSSAPNSSTQFYEYVKSIIIYPLIVRGDAIGLMVLFLGQKAEDISEFKKDFLEQLPNIIGIALDNALLFSAIQDANEKLKQLDRLKDDFVSLASHELRTPMTVIRSYLYMAIQGKAGELNTKQKFYLDRAYSSTVRLINLVNEMLNISRIESGRMSINIQKLDLLTLVNEVVFELKVRAQELGLTLGAIPSALPPVLADGDKIKEVLLNLIGNSFKFTPKGGSIAISFETKDEYVYIHVRDTGVGIPAGDQEKLFQKFSMIGSSYKVNKTDVQGTGLGLFICKSIVELHKGTVTALSDGEGKGSTFTFSLKVYNDKDAEIFLKEFGDKKGLEVIHSSIV